ncbi:MAG: SUMF1/EgtB/PvdO family nonheme iron enzyme [Desulfomonile tiedjei]|uniref:SUMF1/EgtB/PvdO family nonheme iron enzyme n=1 Tax=Desulfomonile tiedjei TaxID=2358 RepID=A0A9D6V097_9BACT|nr:SUMF1/EgtB/PvdO family nonheme iron enzyme [Desulfomonile tiedjei]
MPIKKYLPLLVAVVSLLPRAGLCGQHEDRRIALSQNSGTTQETGSEKLYGAISGYLEVFTRKEDRPKRRTAADVRSRYQGAMVASAEGPSTSLEVNWTLAEKRIERLEFDLAIYPLRRAQEMARLAGAGEKASAYAEMLQHVQAKGADLRSEPAPAREGVNSIGMRLRAIPPGTFSMGSTESELRRIQSEWNTTENALKQETPTHTVQISSPYLLGKYHVTVAQFKAFVEETGYRTVAEKQDWGWVYDNGKKHWVKKTGASWKNPGFEVWLDQPVTMVCQSDAEAFCEWLTRKENRKYHLPTEAQWEYAARGGKEGERFPWGNNYPDGKKLNAADWRAPMPWGDRTLDDGYSNVSPVGSYEPNGFGLHDMVGNLWQFCYDYYDSKVYEQAKSSVSTDPAGPKSGKEIVVRGGNWAFGAGIARNAFRTGVDPHMAADVNGFRVAAALTAQEYRELQRMSENVSTTDELVKLMERARSLTEKGKRSAARKLIEDLDPTRTKVRLSVEPSFFAKMLLDSLIECGRKDKDAFENSLGMTMVRISAGSFLMGSSDADIAWALNTLAPSQPINLENETPLRKVRISRPFFMSSTPVTAGQFRRFVEETGYVTDAEEDGGGLVYNPDSSHFEHKKGLSWKNPGWAVTDDQPVTLVTYNDAEAFVDWLTAKEKLPYKLPTEAQWEYAARGGLSAPRFPWGDAPPDGQKANYADKSKEFPWKDPDADSGYKHVSPVGKFPANGFGLYDMSGNVLQWVRDYYADGYYSYAPEIDPEGPAQGQFRVLKGGDWTSGPVRLRCPFRGQAWPSLALYNSGFRVIIDVGTPVREFHFANDFLTKTWIPGQEQRSVAETVAKQNERVRQASSGSRTERSLSAGNLQNPTPFKGVYILDFSPGSAAKKTGMAKGDVIIEYNGVRDLTSDRLLELSTAAASRTTRTASQAVVVRDGYEYSVVLPAGPIGVSTTDIIVQGPFKRRDTSPGKEREDPKEGSSRSDWM